MTHVRLIVEPMSTCMSGEPMIVAYAAAGRSKIKVLLLFIRQRKGKKKIKKY